MSKTCKLFFICAIIVLVFICSAAAATAFPASPALRFVVAPQHPAAGAFFAAACADRSAPVPLCNIPPFNAVAVLPWRGKVERVPPVFPEAPPTPSRHGDLWSAAAMFLFLIVNRGARRPGSSKRGGIIALLVFIPCAFSTALYSTAQPRTSAWLGCSSLAQGAAEIDGSVPCPDCAFQPLLNMTEGVNGLLAVSVSRPPTQWAGETLAVRCRLVHVGQCEGWRRFESAFLSSIWFLLLSLSDSYNGTVLKVFVPEGLFNIYI
jgi:hypothetical protein